MISRKDVIINTLLEAATDSDINLSREYGKKLVKELESIDSKDTQILDWLDEETKIRCIHTNPDYGRAYADDLIRDEEAPFIALHLNGIGFIYSSEDESTHESFRDAIKAAIKEEV